MNKTTRTSVLALTLAVAGGVGLATAHEPAVKTPQAQMHAMPGMKHDMAGMSEGSKQLHQAMMGGMHMHMHMQKPMSMSMQMPMTGNVDTDFATMMTMHHEQAIRMADVLLKYGKNAELRALAQKMKAAQQQEIRVMAKYKAPPKK